MGLLKSRLKRPIIDFASTLYLPDTASNRLPDTYTSRQNAAVVVDDQQHIYVIGVQSLTSSYSDVYRGYLNQLKWNTLNE